MNYICLMPLIIFGSPSANTNTAYNDYSYKATYDMSVNILCSPYDNGDDNVEFSFYYEGTYYFNNENSFCFYVSDSGLRVRDVFGFYYYETYDNDFDFRTLSGLQLNFSVYGLGSENCYYYTSLYDNMTDDTYNEYDNDFDFNLDVSSGFKLYTNLRFLNVNNSYMVDYWTSLNNNLLSGIDNENSYSNGYSNGYSSGYNSGLSTGYSNGYSQGYVDADNEDAVVNSIFGGILQIAMLPVNFFMSIFDFEILGISIKNIVLSLLSVSLVVIVSKAVFGGKGS